MIIGVGVDIVDVPRFERSLQRTPALAPRLFAESERSLSLRSLAARFAAKEALVKAVGDPTGFRWHDVEVVTDALGKPSFRLAGSAAEAVEAHGIGALHLSLSHDGDTACAFVVAEGAGAVLVSPVQAPDDRGGR
ncbi:holo-ACP synthase [Subtercola boreus]|uniref:Holo-[acyl-carrier-protein] synthase n=1 Tax=Subtercola boreus TaxID=120213 RepID=A0A3E0WA41_9MICO|nr:holo-ACP synthase [Subtercola boreus]RFA19405.1 holo-ACP synthase [Subtercola boreus]RFA19666.1 holo-ACP synthase [Subtercola boreus]RFA26031.1 holo-ACP synthase [Subtercola boreus]